MQVKSETSMQSGLLMPSSMLNHSAGCATCRRCKSRSNKQLLLLYVFNNFVGGQELDCVALQHHKLTTQLSFSIQVLYTDLVGNTLTGLAASFISLYLSKFMSDMR